MKFENLISPIKSSKKGKTMKDKDGLKRPASGKATEKKIKEVEVEIMELKNKLKRQEKSHNDHLGMSMQSSNIYDMMHTRQKIDELRHRLEVKGDKLAKLRNADPHQKSEDTYSSQGTACSTASNVSGGAGLSPKSSLQEARQHVAQISVTKRLGECNRIRLRGDELCFEKHQYKAALTHYEQVASMLKDCVDRSAGAIPPLLQIQVNQERGRALVHAAVCHVHLKQYDKGIGCCDRALEVFPGNVKAFYRRAQLHMGKQQFERALEDIACALELCPNDETRTLLLNEKAAIEEARADCKSAPSSPVKNRGGMRLSITKQPANRKEMP